MELLARQVRRAHKEQQAIQVHRDLPDHKVQPGQPGHRARQAHKGFLVQPGLPDRKDLPALLDQPEPQEPTAKQC